MTKMYKLPSGDFVSAAEVGFLVDEKPSNASGYERSELDTPEAESSDPRGNWVLRLADNVAYRASEELSMKVIGTFPPCQGCCQFACGAPVAFHIPSGVAIIPCNEGVH